MCHKAISKDEWIFVAGSGQSGFAMELRKASCEIMAISYLKKKNKSDWLVRKKQGNDSSVDGSSWPVSSIVLSFL